MKKIFGIPLEKKKELTEILEANPYEKGGFAMIGYKIKEGNQVGGDEKILYLYLSGDKEKVVAAGEKLGELRVDVAAELEEKIIKAITEEEDKAASGMGDIFG